jgi:hypothetical protein
MSRILHKAQSYQLSDDLAEIIGNPILPSPKKSHKLLSPEEVLHSLDCPKRIKHRMILTTCYAAGVRIS